jgi:hypothetical protein
VEGCKAHRLSPQEKGRQDEAYQKTVYYDIDSSMSSSMSSKEESTSKHRQHLKTVKHNSKTSFNYSRIPRNSNTQLLYVPLDKPPHFDGEDYSWWNQK